LSYTILYTVNKQLVNFTFNPVSIDIDNSAASGVESADNAQLGGYSSGLGGIEPINQGGGFGTVSPTAWVYTLTGLPCTPATPWSLIPSTVTETKDAQGRSCVRRGGVGAGLGPLQGGGASVYAKFLNINNPQANRASADGVLSLNGVNYNFRSGGGGNGYLPPGTYTITNGRLRSDNSTMMVEGFGYSFDLSDVFDPRTNADRTLLRIHPDGGGPGTIGCIGVQGNRATQEQFYTNLKNLLDKNGGRYTIRVGM
jgi:hypothetical protein